MLHYSQSDGIECHDVSGTIPEDAGYSTVTNMGLNQHETIQNVIMVDNDRREMEKTSSEGNAVCSVQSSGNPPDSSVNAMANKNNIKGLAEANKAELLYSIPNKDKGKSMKIGGNLEPVYSLPNKKSINDPKESTENTAAMDLRGNKKVEPIYTAPDKKKKVTMEENPLYDSIEGNAQGSNGEGRSDKKPTGFVNIVPDKKGITMEDNVLYESSDNMKNKVVMVDNDLYSYTSDKS